ncbi:cryptochrome/photolyase family protein [Nitrospirillum iridis]|uniref:Deoxyribodipyrimidine photolyase-related protein n=1 Tax=Nitrospirillum iridis TaxID=765888 RepID=A0A7X0AZA1_9PROT|nr:cryptochrome/photolyase family protein [Nitrospirillum iridis]MBB6252892.1 deoxyribodipyrimidine photolyase-related protein [Nitrospirillum iridis]
MTTLRLILGDQLSPGHRWFARVESGVVYAMMEVRQETDYVLHHAQKILAVFAAMRDFARHLRAAGHVVDYLAIGDPANRQAIPANLDMLRDRHGATTFEYQAPDEWRVDRQLADYANVWPGPSGMVDSDHFLSARDTAADLFRDRRRWLMEHFYRHMRRVHGVLLEPEGGPAGGQWNYDHDNRKPWPGLPAEPDDTRPRHDHTALWREIVASGVASFGEPMADRLRWPLNRAEALTQLDAFIDGGLPHFGDYQDAMSTRGWRLFHSLLSFALNVKMLSPREVIAAAENAWRRGAAPLPAVEGFIRQILGWREYVRGVYWAHMPGYDQRNALEHALALPPWFWTGRVGMRCLAQAVGQSLRHAYAHHIQRLMVIGNFALLAGLDPAAVHRWYLGVYVDAFEWVELPNTLGMSQFADGGLMATKPYVSGAAYIDRMGDYCRGCRYDRKVRVGPRACPFNALYWDFLDRHAAALSTNPRLALPYRQLARMDPADRSALRAQAADTRRRLEAL